MKTLLTIMLITLSSLCWGKAVTPKPNAFGAVIYRENPNQYLEGSIVSGDIHKDGKRLFTTIRFSPAHTYSLFTDDVTFCGNQADMFDGMTGDIVVTYSKVMHQTWCFDLYSVHKVAEKNP